MRVVYRFNPRQNKKTVSCVFEVSPAARKVLLKRGKVYLRYAACPLADHVRVVQCFKCLAFGHFAADCKGLPSCGHCAGAHEMRECKVRDSKPKCANCERHFGPQSDCAHSAMDASKCAILIRRIKDRIAYINYD